MLSITYIYVIVCMTKLIYFGPVTCDTEIFNVPEAVNDNSEFCPTTNSGLSVNIPHKKDCNKFFVCDNGIPYLKSCPPGLHFNPDEKACDYPESAGCEKESNIKGRMTEDESSLCPTEDSKQPLLIPHPDDCSKFYMCDKRSAHLKECHAGLHFNVKIKSCDYPENAECDPAFKELQIKEKNGDDFNLCPVKNSKYPILLPHPSDCNKFYICDSGVAHLKECQPGLHFNSKINTCDYPERAGCDKEMKVKMSGGAPSPFCPPVNGKLPIFFRHSTNCSVYYMCGNGLAYEFVCPSRLHFNIRKKVCDYEWNSDCEILNF